MRIKCSLVLTAAILAGCAENPGGSTPTITDTRGPSFRDADTSGGTPIKVSYVRFNELQDPQTRAKRFVHEYRFMLSQGWTNRKGPKANEPFERLWRDAFKAESVPDGVMEELVRKMMAAGFGELRETTVDKDKIETLRRIEKTNDRVTGQRARYITVETESIRKTVAYYDNDDARGGKPGPLIERFLAVETEVIRAMAGYTIQVSVETDSSMPRGKR